MRRTDAGFTLLEIMVALVVFGLVMAGISQTFKFGLIAWRQGPARTAEPENLAALDTALTRIIAQSVPGTMTGLSDRLSFTTRLPPGAGLQSVLADAAILAAPDQTLILRYQSHPAGIPLKAPAASQIETLAQGVIIFQAAYLVRKGSAAPAWAANWKGNGLPLLVRLHIVLADGRDWPDLVVAPVATDP